MGDCHHEPLTDFQSDESMEDGGSFEIQNEVFEDNTGGVDEMDENEVFVKVEEESEEEKFDESNFVDGLRTVDKLDGSDEHGNVDGHGTEHVVANTDVSNRCWEDNGEGTSASATTVAGGDGSDIGDFSDVGDEITMPSWLTRTVDEDGFPRVKRHRSENVTERDKMMFLRILGPYIDIIENRQLDVLSNMSKNQAWQRITSEFNANAEVTRDNEKLRELWKRLKVSTRKEVEKRREFIAEKRKEILAEYSYGRVPVLSRPSAFVLNLLADEFKANRSSPKVEVERKEEVLPRQESSSDAPTDGNGQSVFSMLPLSTKLELLSSNSGDSSGKNVVTVAGKESAHTVLSMLPLSTKLALLNSGACETAGNNVLTVAGKEAVSVLLPMIQQNSTGEQSSTGNEVSQFKPIQPKMVLTNSVKTVNSEKISVSAPNISCSKIDLPTKSPSITLSKADISTRTPNVPLSKSNHSISIKPISTLSNGDESENQSVNNLVFQTVNYEKCKTESDSGNTTFNMTFNDEMRSKVLDLQMKNELTRAQLLQVQLENEELKRDLLRKLVNKFKSCDSTATSELLKAVL